MISQMRGLEQDFDIANIHRQMSIIHKSQCKLMLKRGMNGPIPASLLMACYLIKFLFSCGLKVLVNI